MSHVHSTAVCPVSVPCDQSGQVWIVPHTCIHVLACMLIHVCLYIHRHSCTTCTHMHTNIHTHTRTHTRAHAHTRTHTHTCGSVISVLSVFRQRVSTSRYIAVTYLTSASTYAADNHLFLLSSPNLCQKDQCDM